MPVPISQMATVATYVLKQKLAGRKRYPLVLMLEPLYRCNLSCAGCGKIQYPSNILKAQLSYEECMQAVDECAVADGEPAGRRAADAPGDRPHRRRGSSRARSTSTCAPTRCCSKRSSICSRRRST